jgi:hypothetical protein
MFAIYIFSDIFIINIIEIEKDILIVFSIIKMPIAFKYINDN